jgi:hypothetical protein
MSINKGLNNKFIQQYELAERQRRLLIRSLYELIDDLENQPYLRYQRSFPFGILDRGIQSVLDVIERKFIRRLWAYFRK